MMFSITENCMINNFQWCSQFKNYTGDGAIGEALLKVQSGNLVRGIFFSGYSLCSGERNMSFLTHNSSISGLLYDNFSGNISLTEIKERTIEVPSNCISDDETWWIIGNGKSVHKYPIGTYFRGDYELFPTVDLTKENLNNILFVGDSMCRTMFLSALNIVSNHSNPFNGIQARGLCENSSGIWTNHTVGSNGNLRKIGRSCDQDGNFCGCLSGGLTYHLNDDSFNAAYFRHNINEIPVDSLKFHGTEVFIPRHIIFGNALHGVNEGESAAVNTQKSISLLRDIYPNAKITLLGNWVHNMKKKHKKWAYYSLPSTNIAYSLALTRNVVNVDRFIDLTACTVPFYEDNLDGIHFHHEAVNFLVAFLSSSVKHHPCSSFGYPNKMY